jgi:flagellar hook-associated protein 2
LSSLTLSYTKDGVVGTPLTIAARTPADIVKEINGTSPSTGVKAQLAYTGSEYKVILTGNTGANNSFSLTPDSGLTLPDASASPAAYADAHQASSNAIFKLDGVQYTRTSNLVTDALTGVSLNLRTATNSSTTIDLTRDTTGISDKVKALVASYNDAMSMLNVVSDPKSTVETYGGTLVGDSMVRTVKDQLRNMFLPAASAKQSGVTVNSLRDLGVSVEVTGTMTLDEAKMGTALSTHFDEVVTAFSKNFNDLGEYTPSSVDIGIAGNASRTLTKMLKTTGQIQTQSTNATTQNKKYQEDLATLQTRMDGLLARYQKQFAAMDSMVGRNNALKTSLKSTFDGMANQKN